MMTKIAVDPKNTFFGKMVKKGLPGGLGLPWALFLPKIMNFDMSRSQSIVHINSSYLNVDGCGAPWVDMRARI
jgi:hypothetical protein